MLTRQIIIPKGLKPLFWSYKFEELDLNRDKNLIITQLINYGSLAEWKWLVLAYGEDSIREVLGIIRADEFKPRALKLASLIFGIKNFNHASRGSHR